MRLPTNPVRAPRDFRASSARGRRAALVFGPLLGAAVVASARQADAGSVDTFGAFRFDDGALQTVGFETAPSPSVDVTPGAGALEGSRVGVAAQGRGTVPLASLPSGQGSYSLRLWLRGGKVTGTFSVIYTGSGPQDIQAPLFPTGRATSDGWYEVASAPIAVDGSFPHTASFRFFGTGVEMDALELLREGTYRPSISCSGARDPICGAGQYCSAGECQEGDAYVPKLPEADVRAALSDYFASRLRGFFGGKNSRRDNLPKALATLEAMKSAQTAYAFWNGFSTAIHQLRDWHSSVRGGPLLPGRGGLAICVEEGDADLSHNIAPKDANYPDVLVAYTGATGAAGLHAGDRILTVDGQHPIAWAESLDDLAWDYWHSNDPRGHAEAMELFRRNVRRFAKEMVVSRCDATTKVCGAPETLQIKDLPEDNVTYPVCDHRIRYHVAGLDEATHNTPAITLGKAIEAGQDEALYGMVWDDVMIDGANPYAAPMQTLRDQASMVILDHRTGNGGTEQAAEFLTQLFRPPARLGVATHFTTISNYWESFTTALGQQITATPNGYVDVFNVGSAGARTDLRVALLLSRDGSASDWFPLGMKNGGANIRLFGRQTAGAFSSFFQFDYFGGLGWQFGSGDFVEAGIGETHLGRGVDPDEDLVPLQSDLLVGRDTVYERALAWVRGGN